MAIDDSTVSRLADEVGVPLELAREVCAWADSVPDAVNPVALARVTLHRRKARAAAQPAPPAPRPRFPNGVPHDYADPEVAHRELAKIRAILDGRPAQEVR